MNDKRSLHGRRIAVPESRQLDLFAEMLEQRDAEVLRYPLVDIRDAPDPQPVETWLRRFAAGRCDDLILLTGEGLRRLVGFAERADGRLKDNFLEALGRVRKITRGPKPQRALRELDMKPDLPAAKPTTEGVIESLSGEDLSGRCVGVQLYGEDPNTRLVDYLAGAGAEVDTVAPYVYADKAEDTKVAELIETLASGHVDAIAFTSSAQVRRLFRVAEQHEQSGTLVASLDRIAVAAVGPVVADALSRHEVRVDLMPQSSYFMKPLVRELAHSLGPAS